jgi:UDP-2-acetamido-3-amino-2,3-dideoxy-glucuronate N-acetyltransferase
MGITGMPLPCSGQCQTGSSGVNSAILYRITNGRYAFIEAGTGVTKDALDHALVMGQCRLDSRWKCTCEVTLRFKGKPDACPTCGQQYRTNVRE